MSQTITAAFSRQFDSTLRMATQQKKSRLQSTVTDRGMIDGNAYTVNNVASAGLLDENVVRHGDTFWSDVAHTGRLAYMRDYFKALPLDKADEAKMRANPVTGGQYMESLIAARNRRIDSIIYQAALSPALAVDGSVSYSLPSGQQIAGGGTGFTKAKLFAVRGLFRANETDDIAEQDEELFILWNSVMLTQILSDTQLTSKDYTKGKMLQEGRLDEEWMGFRWIPYEGLNNVAGVYTTVAYAKSGIHFGTGFEEGDVAKREDKKNTLQVSMAASYAAVRQDELKVATVAFQ